MRFMITRKADREIIDVASKAKAIAWVKRWPQIDGHGEVETVALL